MSQSKKNIKVVSGDGKDLDISSVHTHITASKPKIEKKDEKKIVIPEVKKVN